MPDSSMMTDAFATEVMAMSRSPARTRSSVSVSPPSWPPGYCSTVNSPPEADSRASAKMFAAISWAEPAGASYASRRLPLSSCEDSPPDSEPAPSALVSPELHATTPRVTAMAAETTADVRVVRLIAELLLVVLDAAYQCDWIHLHTIVLLPGTSRGHGQTSSPSW